MLDYRVNRILRKIFSRVVFSYVFIFSTLFNSFAPTLFIITPAFASESPQTNFSYIDSTHSFDLTVSPFNDSVTYGLYYKTPEKIEAVVGGGDAEAGEYKTSIYAGTKSVDDSLPADVERGIFKNQVSNTITTYYFVMDESKLRIVAEVPASSIELTDGEKSWLEEPSTYADLQTDVTYHAPFNQEVSLRFTTLPENPGSITIKEITLTDEQMKATGSVTNIAYDITSDMTNGEFVYDLSLPIPETSESSELEVKFAEEISEVSSAKTVENTLTKTDKSVSVESLDHFTIFVVTGASATATITLVNDLQSNWDTGVYSAYYGPPDYNPVSPGTTAVFDGREAGIIKAGFNTGPADDEGIFAYIPNVTINTLAAGTLTYDVINEAGVNPVWMTIEIDTGVVSNRGDNTVYQFVPTTNPAGWHTVDAGAGQWQKWNNNSGDTTGNSLISLSDVATAHTDLNVVRTYLRLGMGDSYYNGGTGTSAWVDKATLGGVTYDFVVGAGSTPTSCTGASITPPDGTTACYSTIQAAINAADPDETINVPAGTYNENLIIDKSLTLQGAGSSQSIINAGESIAIEITADNVVIDGFEIKHTTVNSLDDMGIRLNQSEGSKIQNNKISNNSLGLQLLDAGNNDILSNDFSSNVVGIYLEGTTDGVNYDGGSNGPFYSLSINNNIDGNTISNSVILGGQGGDGIYIDAASESNTINANTITSNAASGYYAWKASNNTVTDNTISGNADNGVHLMGSSGNTVTGNTLSSNINNGLWLRSGALSSTSNIITGNTINENGTGIKLQDDFSSNNYVGVVTGNTISSNSITGSTDYGVSVLDVDPSNESLPINSAENWWGDQSGPSGEGTGIGDSISTNVDFSPWCLTSDCSSDSSIYSISSGATLSSIARDITVGDLTLENVTGTGSLFVAKYEGVPSSGGLSTGVDGFYYSIEYTGVIDFPVSVEITYTNIDPLASDYLDEAHFSSLFYYDGSEWKDYKLDTVETTGFAPSTVAIDKSINKITASLRHLTPIVPVVDTTAPSMSITSPTDSQYISGRTISISGTATDANFNYYYCYVSNVSGHEYGTRDASCTTTWHSVSPAGLLGSVSLPNDLPDGNYVVHLIGKDKVGNTTEVTKQFVLDNTAPITPTHSSPADNSYLTTTNWTLADWSTETDATGSVTYIYESSLSSTTNSDGSFISPAYVSGALTNSQIPTLGTPQGVYHWHVRAIDSLGNASPWSTPWKVTVDNTAPVKPVFTTPANNLFTNINSITLAWSDGDDTGTTQSGIKGYTLRYTFVPMGGGSTVSWSTGLKNIGNPKTHSGSYGHGQGTYTFYVKTTDNSGNVSQESDPLVVTYDATAPLLSSQSTFSDWYNTAQTSTFTYSDTNGVVSGTPVTCDISTQGALQTCSVTPNVCDAAGNCNTTTVTSNGANIDFTDPTSTITIPSDAVSGSTVYLSEWDGSIAGTATDNLSDVSGVQISIQKGTTQYFDGTNFVDSATEILLPTTYAAGEWEYGGLTSPLEGSYTIKSRATDNAGNVESTYTLTIIYDKTIPEVSISINPSVADASNGWYKTQPEVTLTATDTNIDKIEYQWDSKTGTWSVYSVPFKPSSEGAHVLYYRALDKAGNYSDIGVKNIKWDKTELSEGPQNVSVSPNPTSGDKSTVTWEAASDNTGIDHYEIQWKLGDTSHTDSVGSDVRSHELSNLTEGSWTVIVRAFDSAGNSKEASVGLTVDRTAPQAPTLTLVDATAGSASLSWNSVDDAKSYIIWYGTTSGNYLYGANVGNVTSYTVQGLGGGNYFFVVRANDSSGNGSPNSNEVSTGEIAGAPGVEAGAPATGFEEQPPTVLGAETTEASETVLSENGDEEMESGSVLGDLISKNNFKWWYWLLPLLLFLAHFSFRWWYKNRND